ncbi:MAG: hypothetical protein ACI87W_001407 [Halieaceae bacterium]|jgi:hypothetical protein
MLRVRAGWVMFKTRATMPILLSAATALKCLNHVSLKAGIAALPMDLCQCTASTHAKMVCVSLTFAFV